MITWLHGNEESPCLNRKSVFIHGPLYSHVSLLEYIIFHWCKFFWSSRDIPLIVTIFQMRSCSELISTNSVHFIVMFSPNSKHPEISGGHSTSWFLNLNKHVSYYLFNFYQQKTPGNIHTNLSYQAEIQHRYPKISIDKLLLKEETTVETVAFSVSFRSICKVYIIPTKITCSRCSFFHITRDQIDSVDLFSWCGKCVTPSSRFPFLCQQKTCDSVATDLFWSNIFIL